MKAFQNRLQIIENHIKQDNVSIMIIGLGSVGSYLLDYLVSQNDDTVRVYVVGRDYAKMERKVNIIRISALIREKNKTKIDILSDVDLNDIASVEACIRKCEPDFIVNSSRAYSGLKYGSISWNNLRAYGIWSPLAIKYTKNIMIACDYADTNAIVINTSYSDVVIPWLKSAGMAYPDFGSGNFNHLVPRIRYAVAKILQVEDFWNVSVMFASSHFHDVCISKEGQNEGESQLLKVYYQGREVEIPQDEIFAKCSISMPTDATRNMMNASSNYRIIFSIIDAIRNCTSERIYSPGVFGEIGGYPVLVKYCEEVGIQVDIDESTFSLEEMREANKKSLALDGIEDIIQGKLIYTDELIRKCQTAFQISLPKEVSYDEIDEVADFLIKQVIQKQVK